MFTIVATSWPVGAQDVSPAARTEASRLSTEAFAAHSEGRLSDALRLLTESHRLHPRTSSAYSVASVLLDVGRPIDALEQLQWITAERAQDLGQQQQHEIEQLRHEIREAVATLELRVSREAAEMRVDGVVVGSVEAGQVLRHRVNPGEHTVYPVGRPELVRTVELEPGQRAQLVFDLEPANGGTADFAEEESGGTVLESPWFWVVTTAVLIGAVAVGIGVAASSESSDEFSLPVRLVLRSGP